jgi:signal transduction histidine kinase
MNSPSTDTVKKALDKRKYGVYSNPPKLSYFLYTRLDSSRQNRMAKTGPGMLDSLFNSIPCACLVLDAQAQIKHANPSAVHLLALDESCLAGKTLLEIIPSWKETELSKELPSLLAGGQIEPGLEFELLAPNEKTVRILPSILPNGSAPDLLLTIFDSTEFVKLKQRFRWAEYQASIGKLARGVAHELNNPLDGVLRYTHLAIEQLSEDSPVREHLVHVKEGLDRMVKAVKAFLEFSRQASMPVTRQANLNQLIEDALLLVRHRVRFQQIRIVKELDPTLPPVLDGGLQHAIVNMIKNALDSMPKGGTLKISSHSSDSVVELEVEDTGCGIPEEIKARLFEPFFSTKAVHQGSGLGLVIAKEAVERSGGELSFDSKEGIGTTFRLEVPAAKGWYVDNAK